jgi:hypothetical protein
MLERVHANIKFEGVECPNKSQCSNTGSYGVQVYDDSDDFNTGLWHEVQCEFCYENKTSVFNMANYSDGFSLDQKVTKDLLQTMLDNSCIDSKGLGDMVNITIRTAEKEYKNIPTKEAHGKIVAVFKLDDVVRDEQYFTIHGKGRCLKHKVFDVDGKQIADLRYGSYLLFEGSMVGSHIVMSAM